MDKIVLESRQEIELLQNICESFYAFSKAPGEEDERNRKKIICTSRRNVFKLVERDFE